MIRKRGDRWQAIVRAPADPITGRERQLSGTAANKKDAERLERQLKLRADTLRGQTTGVTVAQAADEWWACKPQLAATTAANYRQHLDVHILPTLGHRPLDDLRPRLVASWMGHLADKGLAPGSVRKARTVLSSLMAWAVAMEMVESNPVMKVPPPPLDSTPRPAATLDECARLLVYVAEHDPDFADYLWVAIEEGGRRGETLGVRWCDVDLDAGTITLRQSVTGGLDGVQIRPHGKKKQGRTIALSSMAVDRLRVRKERLAKLWAGAGGELGDTWLVFSGGNGSRRHPLDGKPWTPDAVSHKFARIKEQAGVRPEVDLHGLRRAMISELLTAGVDPRTVMGRAGHSSTRMTMEVYGRVREPADAAAAELFGRLLADEIDRQG